MQEHVLLMKGAVQFSVIIICNFLKAYDPELFSKALPCLSAIGCALSPDYSLSHQDENLYNQYVKEANTKYEPQPVDTAK